MGIFNKLSPSNVFGGVSDVWHDFTGQSGQESANKTNVKLQRQQQSWEEMMANTAVQRRQADLKAAGINPLLAASGTGADVPNVAPARVENVQSGNAKAVETAVSSAQGLAQMALAGSQTRKNNAEAGLIEQTTPANVAAATARVDEIRSTIDNINNDTDLKFWDVAVTKIEGKLKNMDVNQRNLMYPLLVQEQAANSKLAEAGVPAAQKRAKAWESIVGDMAAYAELITPTFNSAVGAGALGKVGQYLRAGQKVKGGLPKHIGTFDKRTGEIFDK